MGAVGQRGDGPGRVVLRASVIRRARALSALSTLLARCCCGGQDPYNGNTTCVPPCAGQPAAFKTSWSATSQFFSRGTPTGFSNVTRPCSPCFPTTSLYSSGNFDVGSYPETFVQPNFPRFLPGGTGCEECDTLTVSWQPSPQSFSAVVRDPPNPAFPSAGQTLSVGGEPFNVQSNWYRCNPFAQGGVGAFGCEGWSGLFEVVYLRAGRVQYSPSFPIYGQVGDTGSCPVGPVEDGYAMSFQRSTSVGAFYVKPVPFSSCIDRRGTYYLAAAEASYPWTTYELYLITGFPAAARLWSDPCSFESYSLCEPANCSNPSEVRCGKSPPGWTLPGTIEVTAL